MSDSPDLGRSPGEATGFGVTHYVQAALSILVALFVGWVASSAWRTYNLPNQGVDPNDDGFICFVSFPLTALTCVIGIFTLRMLKRQGASFV